MVDICTGSANNLIMHIYLMSTTLEILLVNPRMNTFLIRQETITRLAKWHLIEPEIEDVLLLPDRFY